MTMAAAQAGAWPGVNGPDDVLDRAAHCGGPAKRMYGDCGGGSSRRVRSNPDRPCGLLDPCASKGACTGLRGPLVQQCTGGYPVTQWDLVRPKATARESGKIQLTGYFRRWWQVLGSNQRRLSPMPGV